MYCKLENIMMRINCIRLPFVPVDTSPERDEFFGFVLLDSAVPTSICGRRRHIRQANIAQDGAGEEAEGSQTQAIIQKRHGVLPSHFGKESRWPIRHGNDAEDMQHDAEPAALAGGVRSSR